MKPSILIAGAVPFGAYLQAIGEAGGKGVWSGSLRDAAHCHGLLLPGGGDVEPWRYGRDNAACRETEPQQDRLEFALTDCFLRTGRPVLGICRGLQVLNVYFGGTLHQHIRGHDRTEGGIDRIHKTVLAPSFLKDIYGSQLLVNSAHHQSVDRLGEGLRCIQRSADGTVEGMEHETLPVWGVQWHPERLCANGRTAGMAVGDLLMEAFVRRCAGV